jgi:hypothetical protein
MACYLRSVWLCAALIVAAICLGCGGTGKAPSSTPPEALQDEARRVDAGAIDQAIAAVERGESAELLLQGAGVTGADLRRIGRLHSLRELNLGTQPVDLGDDDLLALRDLARLEVLVLGAAPISDDGLAAVRGMRELKRLNVTDTRITDDGLAILAELPKLESLRIGGALITDQGMAHLKKLKQLKALILHDCPLTDGSLSYLREMRHLESLYLFGTSISDQGLSGLEEALRAGPWPVHVHY